MEFFDFLQEFNLCTMLIRVFLAALLGGLIGSERGRHGRAAGLRTHILVCVGSAMTSLTGLFAVQVLGNTGDVFRISAQVVSGIGFLGVGMILVRNRTVITGLTTAAGLWATATIGIAVGYGFYVGAVAATLLCVVAVPVLGHFEEKKKTITNLYIEVSETNRAGEIVRELRSLFSTVVSVDIIAPKSNAAGRVGILLLVKAYNIPEETLRAVEQLDGIDYIVEDCNA
ncbi:MAG: MgtC/SapB family protein [Clostridia bacterium]|nr:MgtC/SapB family protein [Clostridia bacterium]MBQ7037884.1 MgtC/SapB family protein [Clostridia bacterium]